MITFLMLIFHWLAFFGKFWLVAMAICFGVWQFVQMRENSQANNKKRSKIAKRRFN